MSEHQQMLFNKLWAIANTLRGTMDASEFKNYMLGFIFYKHLSEKVEKFVNKELEADGISFEEAYKDNEYREALQEEAVETIGYFLEPSFLFRSLVEKAKIKEFLLDDLSKALKEIEQSTQGHESEDDFIGLFSDVDLTSPKLGRTPDAKNKTISEIILHLNDISFDYDDVESDILGDAYEYLIGQFASDAGKKAGEFYTPQQVSKILSKIVTLGKTKLKSVYDPTCGSGSLLLRVKREMDDRNGEVAHISGQELNQTTYNLARMNMLLHNVKFDDFDIKQGNTLENPQHMGKTFEAVVANPPFSANWSADSSFLDDDRFSKYGKLAPKSKADFAFVQHMLYHLDDNGTMAVVLPHGVLFRGSAEEAIRKYIIKEKNWLDAVIGLPSNLFYGTSIPTAILVFKKCRKDSDEILFIDASNDFEKNKNQNSLTEDHIEKILKTYAERIAEDKYSHKATLQEVEENDYNLNIPRYVNTFEEEESIDLDKISDDLQTLESEMKNIDKDILKYCEELGIKAPIV